MKPVTVFTVLGFLLIAVYFLGYHTAEKHYKEHIHGREDIRNQESTARR
jgi:hypothetical protein